MARAGRHGRARPRCRLWRRQRRARRGWFVHDRVARPRVHRRRAERARGCRRLGLRDRVGNASALTFDGQGRLWVATADYADNGNDGLFVVARAGATPVEVVKGLHTPLGLLWIGDTLYVSGTGGVERYVRFDGTAFTSHERVLTLPDDVGEVNGMAQAPDGRIWMGISAPCDHCTPVSVDSAAVVSFLPDGTDLQVEATGIRAAVGLVFRPGTSELLATINQRDDLGAATPGDWLAVVSHGQAWGFPDCYGQGGAPCAGAPAPLAVLDPHAAVSGVAVVTGPLSAGATSSAVAAEWSTGNVLVVPLASEDATATVLLTGFTKPMPLAVGSSGELFVGDWGTGSIYAIAAA